MKWCRENVKKIQVCREKKSKKLKFKIFFSLILTKN